MDFYVSFSVFSAPSRLISIVSKDFFYFWVFLRFSKILIYFIGSLQEILVLFLKSNAFFKLFRFFSVYWRFVLILWEFSVNFKDFSQFFKVSWTFLEFMGCSWLVLEFFMYLLGLFDAFEIEFGSFKKIFWLLCFLTFFYDFSSVFWGFFGIFPRFSMKFLIYFSKLMLIIGFFQFFSVHWRFVLIF